MFGSSRRAFEKNSKATLRHRKQSFRKFESLEYRRLLTTFNVTTTIDRLDPTVTLAHPKGTDGKLSLREAIFLANINPGADTVVLKAKSTYSITIAGAGENADATGDFDVLDNLTIKATGSGANPIINGNGLDRVIDIPSGFDGVSLTLDHLVVTGGIARGSGGGVAGESDDNTLTFTNTSVTGNISTSPGGGSGGGISNKSGDVNVINSHVDNNSSAAGVAGIGGGIFMGSGTGVLTLKSSTVNGNSAYDAGGGIFTDSTNDFIVTNSQINNNHAGSGPGGGVFNVSDNVMISGSTISGNTAANEGGGLAIDFGGTGSITITKSNFINNSSVSQGGGLWCDGAALNVSASTFKDNSSTAGPGGAISEAGAVQVTDSVFNHNVASGVGGAIDQGRPGDITILRSTFTKNASTGDSGGAIFAAGSISNTISVTDSKFTYNSAVGSGGAIQANDTEVTALRSTFDHNTSTTGFGGAIDQGNVAANIDATDSTFTYNTAKADGGAFNSEGGRVFVTRCVISFNTVTNGQGGGFADEGAAEVSIIDSTISGNTAGGNGGGFAATGEMLTMTGSTVSGNRSGSEGGGIYIATTGTISNSRGSSIINCTISGNGAAFAGGGIDFEGNGDLTIINATIAFNVSSNGGGIAQTDGTGTIHIGNTIVAKNTATNGPDAYNTQAAFDDLGHNLVFADPDLVFTNSSDLIGVDPLLKPLANNGGPTQTHALSKHSPAENAADEALAPPTDQRGVKRPRDGQSDIGAYESK